MIPRNHFFRGLRVEAAFRSPVRVTVMALVLLLAACGQVSYTPEQHLERGVAFQEQGDLSAASIEFRNVLQQEPSNAEGRYRLGMLLLQLGDGAGAAQELERARAGGWDADEVRLPLIRAAFLRERFGRVMDETRLLDSFTEAQVPEVLTLRGMALLGMGNPREAGQAFVQALNLEPGRVDAQIGMAVVEMSVAADGTGDARRWLETALEADSQSGQAWGLLGSLERTAGRLDEADAAYTKAIQHSFSPYAFHVERALTRLARADMDGMEQDLRAMRRLDPQAPGNGYIQGLIRYTQGRYSEAQSAFEESLATAPDFQPAVFSLGVTHFALQNWQQAEYNLQRFLRSHPDSDQAERLLARVRLMTGDMDRAEPLLRSVLGRNPDDPEVLSWLGNVYFARGQYTEGVEHLRRLASIRPDDPESRSALAAGLLQSGDHEEGLRELEAAVELAPGEYGLEASFILNVIRNREFERALTAVEDMLERLPDNPLPYNLRATAYAAMGDMRQAREALLKALELAPGDPSSTMNLAQIERQRGNLDEVKRLYVDALQVHPEHLKISLQLAQLEAERGEVEAGVRLLNQAIEHHPEALEPRLILADYHLRENEPGRTLELLEPLRASQATDARFLDVLIRAQLATGRNEQAASSLRTLAGILPRDANTQHRLGYGFEQAGAIDEARSYYLRALDLEPWHTGALPNLALLEFRQGRTTEAMQLARRMQAESRLAAAGHALEGQIHLQSEQFENAIQAFSTAYGIQASPVHLLNLRRAYQGAGDPGGAVTFLRGQLKERPDAHNVRLHLAEVLLATGENAAAIEEYVRLLEVEPANVLLLNNLAYLYSTQDDPRALEYAERAYALQPGNPAVANTLGWILVKGENPERGLELLERARSAAPDRLEIRYHYAAALSKLGQTTQARRELENLLGEGQDFPQRPEAEALLETLE